MNVSSAAVFPTALAGLASDQQSSRVQAEIALAVTRQIQDTQQLQAEAILRMIQQTAALARGGVDVYA